METVVNINKVTTKVGDGGKSYSSCGMLSKSNPWFDLIGNLDELNAAIGVAAYHCKSVSHLLSSVQSTLFDIGADIYTRKTSKFCSSKIAELESEVLERKVDLTSFVIPSGESSYLHVARAIARKTEREFWKQKANKDMCIYLNRLSDLLFVLALECDDVKMLWEPGSTQG